MGIIAAYTPEVANQPKTIPRKKIVSADDIKEAASIRIILPAARSDSSWDKLTYSTMHQPLNCIVRRKNYFYQIL